MGVVGRSVACFWAVTVTLLTRVPTARGDELYDEERAARSAALEEIGEKSAEAAEHTRMGDELAADGDPLAALGEYKKAAVAVPDTAELERRMCEAHEALDQRAEALTHCERARTLADTPVNKAELARVLMRAPKGDDKLRAEQFMNAALKDKSLRVLATQCELHARNNDPLAARNCLRQLLARAPNSVWPALALAELTSDDEEEAEALLERAKANGARESDVADVRAQIVAHRSPYAGPLRVLKWFLAIWFFLGVAVFGAGLLLSAATKRVAATLPPARGAERRVARPLRLVYRAVLWLTCLLFYVTLPVMVISVFGMAAGFLYATIAIGRIPLQIAALVIGACVVTLFATIRGLFARRGDHEPGVPLDLEENPGLVEVLEEVATKLDTRPIDAVYLRPGAEAAVFERASLGQALRGVHRERCLILGVAALKGMKVDELKAVLAHEYGHLKNEDTAGGELALRVQRSALELAASLAEGGAATWYNPAWWLVKGFYDLFLRVSHGASRWQEILADRGAAFAYGADAFERGLRHIIRRAIAFGAVADAAVKDAVSERRTIANIYRLKAPDGFDWKAVDDELEAALHRQTSAYDSHPAPDERFRLVRKLETEPHVEPEAPAWSLFGDRVELESRFTAQLLEGLRWEVGYKIYKPRRAHLDRSSAGE